MRHSRPPGTPRPVYPWDAPRPVRRSYTSRVADYTAASGLDNPETGVIPVVAPTIRLADTIVLPRMGDETEPATPTQDTGQSLGKSSALMASGTAVSRALGLVRNILLVAAIGTTGLVANAFDVANRIPNIFFAILAGGVLNAVLVPQIIRAYASKNPEERLNKLLTLSATVLLVVTAVLTSASSIVVALYAGGGFTSPQMALAVSFAFWCTPQLFFYGLYTLLGQVLNARGQFGPFMWAPVLNNVVSIIGFAAFIAVYGKAATGNVDDLALWDGPKIALLAGTATLGVAAQAVILFVPLWRSGFRWHIQFGYRGIGLRSAGGVAMWTFGAVILDQLGVLATTRITTGAPDAELVRLFGQFAQPGNEGAFSLVTSLVSGAPNTFSIAGNASYTQALMIYLLPHSLVTVSIATALFTGMSTAANVGDYRRVREILSQGLRTIGVFTVFATAVLIVLAGPLTKVLVPSVTASGGAAISQVLVAMSIGLVPLGAMVLMKWVYYAYEDGRRVFTFQIPATLLLIGLSWIGSLVLAPKWWVVGVGAAMSTANIVAVLGRTAGLRRHLHGLDGYRIVRTHVKVLVATLVSAAVGWAVLKFGFGSTYGISWGKALLITAVVGLLMAAVYLGGLRAMRVKELSDFLSPVMRRIKR